MYCTEVSLFANKITINRFAADPRFQNCGTKTWIEKMSLLLLVSSQLSLYCFNFSNCYQGRFLQEITWGNNFAGPHLAENPLFPFKLNLRVWVVFVLGLLGNYQSIDLLKTTLMREPTCNDNLIPKQLSSSIVMIEWYPPNYRHHGLAITGPSLDSHHFRVVRIRTVLRSHNLLGPTLTL